MIGFRMTVALRTQKQNAPGFGDPRAFALPREIGVTDLRGRIRSMDENKGQQMPLIAHARQRVADSAHRHTGFGGMEQHD